MFAGILTQLGGWARSIPGWTAERRSAAMAVSAAVLLVMAVAAVVTARMTVPPRAAPPQVGGAAEPPLGFAVVPASSATATSRAGRRPPRPREVTIRNGGDADVDGWTGTITLP